MPEYWLLFVDGFACSALVNQAPYKGVGAYSVDLATVDPAAPMPTDGAAHNYSVALVGSGVAGPQSPSVAITLSPVVALPPPVLPPLPPTVVWPVADSLATQ